ncbi:MAG: TRAP transporter large permease [Thermodesulfobacteriota bacterium]
MTLFILIASFFLLVGAGMPIAFAIGVSSFFALMHQGLPVVLISHYMFAGLDSFTLCAVPMFILAGEIMLQGGLTRSLTDLADLLVGRIRGGLGHTNIVGSMFFAGITGSATADCAAIGSLLIPVMSERGYGRAYSTAVTIAGAIIGPIIPPSLTFIIYALAVGQISIGGLFMAGIVPGLLTGLGLMVVNYRISRKRNYERRTYGYSKRQILDIVRKSAIVLVMPALIVGGILSGIYTATESAAAAAAYALIIGFVFFRLLKLRQLPDIFVNSAKVTAIMIVLLATSNIFSYVLVTENVPVLLADLMHSLTDNKYIFLFILNCILFVIGCLVDLFPAILIFGPIFGPIGASYGVDPLHFGIIFCVNLLIGLNTPPVGSGLMIGAALGGVTVEELTREMVPFLIIQVVVMFLITYVPIFTLLIPKMAGF